jgi:hypothetical protein
MRNAANFAAVAVTFLSAAAVLEAAPALRLSATEVEDAIRWGRRASARDVEQYVLKTAPTWTVNFDTPYLRVAQMAHAWKGRERELTLADVPAGLLDAEVHVYALALQQPGVHEKVRNILHVSLRRPGPSETIQPVSIRSSVNRARARGDFGAPAGLARSVEAAFNRRDFVAGHVVRVDFQDGGSELVEITGALLARAR